jgi:hypothetical protein
MLQGVLGRGPMEVQLSTCNGAGSQDTEAQVDTARGPAKRDYFGVFFSISGFPNLRNSATEICTDSLKGGPSRFGREATKSEIHLALAAESLVVGRPEDGQHSRLKIINLWPGERQVLHLHEVRYNPAGCHSTDPATLPGRLLFGTACRTRARYRVERLSGMTRETDARYVSDASPSHC